MKKLKTILLMILSASALLACHHDQKFDSKSSADTLNNMKDSIVDSSKSITKNLVMKVNRADAKFAVEAASGGMAEVELGKLAQSKAKDQKVKDFGAMMVKDHSKANDKMMAIAKSKGITLPITLSKDEQKLMDDLNSRSGSNFDKAYVQAMIDDHKEDVKAFEIAIPKLKDADLKTFATETLPVLKMHLESIQKVRDAMK
jgi:putative membrane protein